MPGELEALAKDKDSYVRSAAAIALAERGDTAAIPVLLDLIKNDAQFRAYQVQASRISRMIHGPWRRSRRR